MKKGATTLVLAGAREAHGLIIGLLSRQRPVIVSLPEPERGGQTLTVPTRVGRFAGPDEMSSWMRDHQVATVLDASHPFDDDVSNTAARLCHRNDIRYLRVLRAGWRVTSQDRWTRFASVREAANAVLPGARVFSNTGFGSLPEYSGFSGHRLYLRQTEASQAPLPYPFVRIIEGKPPFSQQHERALFEELRITRLICRDTGGVASMSKLLAARSLGIRVLMVNRPPVPVGATVVDSVAEALAWASDTRHAAY